MSTEVRLKSGIVVAAEIRRCNANLLNAVVLHRGDDERGLILIKQYVHGQGAKIFTQSRDIDGQLKWQEPLGDGWVLEQKADQYIARQRDFDPDLWVIEIDDIKGAYNPVC